MRFDDAHSLTRRALSLLLSAALLGIQVPGRAQADAPPEANKPPEADKPTEAAAQVLRDLACGTPIPWYLQTDIGLLHVYCDGSLRTFDLLDAGKSAGRSISPARKSEARWSTSPEPASFWSRGSPNRRSC